MEYYGVYDYKESDTFRPTIEKRIHQDYPVSKTITTRDDSCCVILSGGGQIMRIRKLVPVECAKLMCFTRQADTDLKDIAKLGDGQRYHCYGDSICVNVLVALIGKLLSISDEELQQGIKDYIEEIKES